MHTWIAEMKFLYRLAVFLLFITSTNGRNLQRVLDEKASICPEEVSVTTSTNSDGDQHYPGQLIFNEDFHNFDLRTWKHEITMAGKTNGEFQMYDSYHENSYVRDGILFIKPSALADKYGENFLHNGTINLGNRCTDNDIEECSQTSSFDKPDIINPIVSARINTRNSFAFRFGKVEVRAKVPSGDWVWPAIWLLPQFNVYGGWPKTGEIDIMESRGNRDLFNSKREIGSNLIASTLHFGVDRASDPWYLTHFRRKNSSGFHSDFHTYGVTWTPDYIKFSLDDQDIGQVNPPLGGFWELGKFKGEKIWSENKMSPFDQKFYIILNVAVGGTSGYFPDGTTPKQKPWRNRSPHAKLEFWDASREWRPTWRNEAAAMQVDYVRVWAL